MRIGSIHTKNLGNTVFEVAVITRTILIANCEDSVASVYYLGGGLAEVGSGIERNIDKNGNLLIRIGDCGAEWEGKLLSVYRSGQLIMIITALSRKELFVFIKKTVERTL